MIPVIQMKFAPVKGGRIVRPFDIPVTTQRVTIETPYGVYSALVCCIGARQEELAVDDIYKK